MSWGLELGLFLLLLLGLLISGMWVPFAIATAGLFSLYTNFGSSAFGALGLVTWGTLNSFTLSAIPMFVLMAVLLSRSGISDITYRGLTVLVRRLPGGLLLTNIVGCALFAAISGSSVATAASIGSVALPQLKERNYDARMSCGSLAGGGALGILIPPSITMIIYGSITETSISKLFMAGLLPGIGLAVLFFIYVAVRCMISPELAPRGAAEEEHSSPLLALLQLLPFVGLILVVLGGIYSGFATPTEAAGLGCALAVLLLIGFRRFSLTLLRDALIDTVRTSATLLFIILAAFIFSYSVEISGVGEALKTFVTSLNLGQLGFLLLILVLFAVLGCILDGAGMVVLAVPLFFPLLASYHIDPIWFGVLVVMLVEFGMLTPPFGINIFVVRSIANVPLGTVVAGCVPYYFIILFAVGILIAFPGVATFLPGRM